VEFPRSFLSSSPVLGFWFKELSQLSACFNKALTINNLIVVKSQSKD
jgi:hypothetical protein